MWVNLYREVNQDMKKGTCTKCGHSGYSSMYDDPDAAEKHKCKCGGRLEITAANKKNR